MTDDQVKIEDAVTRCLAYVARFNWSALAASDFLALLSATTGWTDGERAEVARRVNEELATRAKAEKKPDNNKRPSP
jgi:hypothetical protein